ncbi:NAD(P)/FAD-dependent oxidoreductase [Myxacorys almedinensis]|uniref:FAD-dependent oxidoreductase n=1 Tax=Myxacorys almedinensis A TaxID=2690445 RepID=A0A8J8CI16_9CYAN|nr:FAD-dependent oxidoreductase [Myxacorys almedinensis]NDJ17269.1 FAD-dependent oxidoreductase [Myxacorys almedinensis A]
MTKVTIAGCGIVGAMIAYELSKISAVEVTVLDQQPLPVEPHLRVCPSATGAALGVLMGAISKKEKGNNLRMRLFGIQSYEQTIPELEALTGLTIPFNRQGILMLQFDDDLSSWQRLIPIREKQGWRVEIWNCDRVHQTFPHLGLEGVSAAVYSPGDRQVNPVDLTRALIAGAKKNGAVFKFNTRVINATGIAATGQTIHTSDGDIASDYLIISAGLGSSALTTALAAPVEIRPVLGQALHLRLKHPLSDRALPVVSGNDVHLVPLSDTEYWVGATVEFPTEEGISLPPNRAMVEAMMDQAIALCPAIAQAETIRTWQGVRPRPQGRPAPIIEVLPGYPQILLATGHYRNGVLLAPATAAKVKTAIFGFPDQTMI